MENGENGSKFLNLILKFWPLLATLAAFISGFALLNFRVEAVESKAKNAEDVNVVQTSEIAVLKEGAKNQAELLKEMRDDIKTILKESRK